ncbi:MAG: hypothetical protein A2W25_15245 [candidate division Zixibacteria bacterium RBG_16_53_22]|nr:MAG: hypothetical protein A2W25_15245 [candidate division Zixibacteria bacterium RBG_16_53_22]
MLRGVVRAEAVVIGNIEAAQWMLVYSDTHDGNGRIEWPDGGCYLQQVAFVPEIFRLAAREIRQYQQELANRKKR